MWKATLSGSCSLLSRLALVLFSKFADTSMARTPIARLP